MTNNSATQQFISNFVDREIDSLLDMSVRIGSNPLLVQASNGNASIKLDGVLWIKASGRWLANAKYEGTLVPVDLAQAKDAVRNHVGDAPIRCLVGEGRPSIETPMHAILPHRIVLHVHSVNTIVWAVRRDAEEQLAVRLGGLRWKWIPYVPSGVPLAREIEKTLSRGSAGEDAEAFVLGNHGLVVCGNNMDAVEMLLAEVERRLALIPRKFSKPETALFAFVAHSSRWRLSDLDELHVLGTDPIARKILKGGVLYPCQAVYLGRTVRTVPHSVPLSRFAEYANGRDGEKAFVVVEDGGVIVNSGITAEEEATLIALMRVVQRIDESAALRYLMPAELMALDHEGPHPYLANAQTAIGPRDTLGFS